MKLLTCALVAALPLIFSTQVHAEFGTLEEVVQAAQNNVEPSYQHELMSSIYRHLNRFSGQINIKTPREKLILLRSYGALFSLAHQDAIEVAKDSAALVASASALSPSLASKSVRSASEHSSLGLAKVALQKIIKFACHEDCKAPRTDSNRAHQGRSEGARERAKEMASTSALTATWSALRNGATLQEAAAVAYRVSEWVILNQLASQIVWLLPEVYSDESPWVPATPKQSHLFSNHDEFNRFVTRNCPHTNAHHMLYLNPILAELDSLSDLAAAFQFYQGKQDQFSVVSWLPREIIHLIASKI